eukprot:73755-Prorocentrum_lima.AAC.1
MDAITPWRQRQPTSRLGDCQNTTVHMQSDGEPVLLQLPELDPSLDIKTGQKVCIHRCQKM